MSNHTQNNDWVKTLVQTCVSKLSPIHITLISIVVVFFGLQLPNSSTCDVKTDSFIDNQYNGRAEYERLKVGMSLVQVESILGRGMETERSRNTSTFEFKNADCSAITVLFENGELINKKQLNLQ